MKQKYFLGKLIIQKHTMVFGDRGSARNWSLKSKKVIRPSVDYFTIIFFDDTYKDFSTALKKFKMLTSNPNNPLMRYFNIGNSLTGSAYSKRLVSANFFL